jgi:hypothetical protein
MTPQHYHYEDDEEKSEKLHLLAERSGNYPSQATKLKIYKRSGSQASVPSKPP